MRIVNSQEGSFFYKLGYEKFRCRIETKERGFFKKRTMYRAIVEGYHPVNELRYQFEWIDFHKLEWQIDKNLAIVYGNKYLDILSKMEKPNENETPEGMEYI